MLIAATVSMAANHPRLVSIESTNCTICHDEMVAGAHVHAPVVEDCTTCHEMTIGDEGTTVELTGAEPDLCIMCHDGLEAAAAGELEVPHAPVTDSCLSCHEVHSAAEERLLMAPPAELCAMCHDAGDLQTSHGGQLTEGTDCRSCHHVHGSVNPSMLVATTLHSPFAEGSCDACHREPYAGRIRLQARGERVCTACHGEMNDEAGEEGSVHAALVGDRRQAGCISCHDPHMSANQGLLAQPVQELCATCHSKLSEHASADNGHAPAAEDCLTCHLPHAAAQGKLLIEVPPELCFMCHDADDADLGKAHLGADIGGLDCLGCHSPHGEGSPHLLAGHIHPPILDGCDTCHDGAADALMEDGESTLCLACHDNIGELAESAPVTHAALEMVRCADCHSPHASPQAALLREPSGGVCTVCHDDVGAAEGEVMHGVIDLIGCQACHEPHGGENGQLLRAEAVELCLECHDATRFDRSETAAMVKMLDRFEVPTEVAGATASVRLGHGHPVLGHLAIGTPTEEELRQIETTHTGDLSCMTCHSPHKGRSAKLFLWDAVSRMDACMHCHPK
jgi:predicted CXXCH cytochrome family protein